MSHCTALVDGTTTRKYVTGIFEASITTSLSLINDHESLGIVSTGKVWEDALESAAHEFLGAEKSRRFAACETTGLNASELHDLPAGQVRGKMMDATKRLLRRGKELEVKAICLGCAGMVGLDDAVRMACVEELGEVGGMQVRIVDGVTAGVGMLYGLARSGF
jgi:Asp/Glu/hydantoin racemase